ncbi:hypothetical protein [Rhodococcus sp. 114MFTsu3.1]|uniref:hypothetical protein n=1 Tax=Rhodococcus sp. 114MFTsu3.1 TaxID=1172184 RepID=UPI00036C1BCA|nr:hypothetical protein [Rhodococcus sp. 114MFTsu3.1]
MESDLVDLARCNQGTHFGQAAVARGEVEPQPQVAEDSLGGELHDARRRSAVVEFDARCALLFSDGILRK